MDVFVRRDNSESETFYKNIYSFRLSLTCLRSNITQPFVTSRFIPSFVFLRSGNVRCFSVIKISEFLN